MADPEDIRWLRESANDLNNLLQIIVESSAALNPLCEQQPEAAKYLGFIRQSLERAKNVTALMASRLGGLANVDASATLQPAPVPAKAGTPLVTNAEGTLELILLIDDEEMIGVLAGDMLAQAGYRVSTAVDAFRALEIFRELKNDIALVILDFTLPIMDGSEVFDELRKIRPDVAVMLSSGFAEQAKVRAMLAKGLRGFLPKPYTEEKLLAQVRIVLDSIRSERTGERRVM
jgi:CheY-like chemotaxis protein